MLDKREIGDRLVVFSEFVEFNVLFFRDIDFGFVAYA